MLRRWVAAIVLVVATVACGDVEPSAPSAVARLVGDVPVSLDDVTGPGAVLGDGYVVPDGAALLGAPVPIGVSYLYLGEPILDHGWSALLLVTGDPRPVVADLARQASAQGLVTGASVFDPTTGDWRTDAWCRRDGEAYRCGAEGSPPDPADPRRLSLQFARQPEGSRRFPRSFLTVWYSRSDRPLTHGGGAALPPGGADAIQPGPEPPEVPTEWPALPAEGGRLPLLGPGPAAEPDSIWAVEVQEGSHAVTVPVGDLGVLDPAQAHLAWIAVDGDPVVVLGRYLRAFRAHDCEVSEPERRRIGGASLTQVSASISGGDSYELRMVERRGHPTYLQISSSYD